MILKNKGVRTKKCNMPGVCWRCSTFKARKEQNVLFVTHKTFPNCSWKEGEWGRREKLHMEVPIISVVRKMSLIPQGSSPIFSIKAKPGLSKTV